jgi:hypothetical protein
MACGDGCSNAETAARFLAREHGQDEDGQQAGTGQDVPGGGSGGPEENAGRQLAWYADSAYGIGELRAMIVAAGNAAVIKPKDADALFVQELTDDAEAGSSRPGWAICSRTGWRSRRRTARGGASTPATRCAAVRPLRRPRQPGAPPGLTSRPGSSCTWPAYTPRRRNLPGPRALRPGGAVSCPRCLPLATARSSWPETSTPPSITRSSAGSCAAVTRTPPARPATGCPLPGDRNPAAARPCSPSTTS